MAKERQMSREMTKNKLDELLTTKEAAAYLKIPIGSFRNIVSKGEIRPLKCGRLNRYTKQMLLDYLRK